MFVLKEVKAIRGEMNERPGDWRTFLTNKSDTFNIFDLIWIL